MQRKYLRKFSSSLWQKFSINWEQKGTFSINWEQKQRSPELETVFIHRQHDWAHRKIPRHCFFKKSYSNQ